MTIDPALPIPLYFQLKTLLLEEILQGRFAPGARLPTEHELCVRFGISRTPVTRALSELAEEGVIVRHRRRGSFVNPHWEPPRGAELRVVVPEGPWEAMVREACPPDTRVAPVSVPLPQLHQFLIHAVAEGRGPDLAVLDSVWVAEFAAAGFLWPLEELDEAWVREELERDFLPVFVEGNRHAGQTFAVQAEADVAGLWYHRDAFERLGLAVPATWDELLDVGRALASSGAPLPLVMPGGSIGGETTTYCLLAFLASNGASVLGVDGITLDGSATVEALRFLRRLIEERVMPAEVVGYEWDCPIRLLAQGQATMSLGGSYEGPRICAAAHISMEDLWHQFGFAPIPAGPHGRSASLAGGMVYGIFRQAAHPKLAMRLLEHVVSADALARMSRSTGQIPPRGSVLAAVGRESPLLSASAEMLDRAIVRPTAPLYARVSAQLQAMLEGVLTGRLGPAAAAERGAELISAITGLPVHRQ